ncbi:hypothetical protein B7494_g5679 [Chlorociboria aeruginascens]|nr:hypothetical protein B7494_g5679 [Chlorociboria aeruginascens]
MALTERASTFLPTIKCSNCARDIEISQMGDHICNSAGEPTPPPDHDFGNFGSMPFKQSPTNGPEFLKPAKPGRVMPPRVDINAANGPYLPQDQLTPNSSNHSSGYGTPNTPSEGRRSPFPKMMRSATAPLIRSPPSPKPLSSNLDSAFPPFPMKPLASPRPRQGGYGGMGNNSKHEESVARNAPPSLRPGTAGGLTIKTTLHTEPDYMYAPVSPRTATSGGVLSRMDTITPGPFNMNNGKTSADPSPVKTHTRTPTASSLGNATMSSGTREVNGHVPRPSTASGHSQTSTSSSTSGGLPKNPRMNGYGGFGLPPVVDDFKREPLTAENRAHTFPLQRDTQGGLEGRPSESGFRNRRPSNESGKLSASNERSGSGSPPKQRNKSVGPDLSRPLPPRGASLLKTRKDIRPGDTPPIPTNVNLAAEFGVGNPYHTPTESQSSNTSLYSEMSKASSRSTPPSGSPARSRRKPSDTSHIDAAMADLQSSMASMMGLQSNDAAPNPLQLPPKTQFAKPMLSPNLLGAGLYPPESPMDPAIQAGRISPVLPPTRNPARVMPQTPPPRDNSPVRRPTTSKGDCKGCLLPIKGKSISSADGRLTGRYHKQCFVCITCREPFATSTFYVHNDAPYCERHYHKLNGSISWSGDPVKVAYRKFVDRVVHRYYKYKYDRQGYTDTQACAASFSYLPPSRHPLPFCIYPPPLSYCSLPPVLSPGSSSIVDLLSTRSMALRLRATVILAFLCIFFYLAFWREGGGVEVFEGGLHGEHVVLHGGLDGGKEKGAGSGSGSGSGSGEELTGGGWEKGKGEQEEASGTSSAEVAQPTKLTIVEQFKKENDRLGLKETSGAIYSSTLNRLVNVTLHSDSASSLTPTDSWTEYSHSPPFVYNPYPNYNTESWRDFNIGEYRKCDGPEGIVEEVKVFEGRPEGVKNAGKMGDWETMGVDANLCFERESRLAAYGFKEEGETGDWRGKGDSEKETKRVKWEKVDWGMLQRMCLEMNWERYGPETIKHIPASNNTGVFANSTEASNSNVIRRADDSKTGSHGKSDITPQAKARTAVLLRADAARNYTENGKQNIRSIITELSLLSGGEYQIFLLVHMDSNKDDGPIWSTPTKSSSIPSSIPNEFHGMTILYNTASMASLYPLVPPSLKQTTKSFLPLQKFSLENPQFEFVWTWDLDSRYTGHHYNFFEKTSTFAKAQPRREIWERNERFFIPAIDGNYDTDFRTKVAKSVKGNSIWGAVNVDGVPPVGPKPAVESSSEDAYEWGINEDADFISLSPIFTPSPPHTSQAYGFASSSLPLRSTASPHSRLSRTLLKTLHTSNLAGAFLSEEVAPATTALIHGLKPIATPIEILFDRDWDGEALDTFYNGDGETSVWGPQGGERWRGSTWGEGEGSSSSVSAAGRLWDIWLGWESGGVGGVEYEKTHGRPCLPPLLLHPIRDVVKPAPEYPGLGSSSK